MNIYNPLLAERKASALTQTDVARLLGISPDVIGRCELGQRHPALLVALGFEVLYGKPVATLFPESIRAVAARMVEGASDISTTLAKRTDKVGLRKRETLQSLAERVTDLLSI